MNLSPKFTPMTFRTELCALWIAEDESKSLRIAAVEEELRVTVWKGLGPETHIVDRPAHWKPPDPKRAADSFGRARLGFVQVELGDPGQGTTYDLMLGWPNSDPDAFGGYQWIAAPPDAKLDDLRLFPEGGASFYEAVLGIWDEYVEEMNEAERGWIEPLSTYRIATATQRSAHRG